MLDYCWPGNVRELENLMERSVLLANGRMINALQLPANSKKDNFADIEDRLKTMTENERDQYWPPGKKRWKYTGKEGRQNYWTSMHPPYIPA